MYNLPGPYSFRLTGGIASEAEADRARGGLPRYYRQQGLLQWRNSSKTFGKLGELAQGNKWFLLPTMRKLEDKQTRSRYLSLTFRMKMRNEVH